MDFVRSHFGKMNLWPVEPFFEHICHLFWVSLLLHSLLLHPLGVTATHPKVMTNMLKKVFNWSEVHLSEVTSYKIYILGSSSTVLPACQAVPSVIVFSSLLWVLGFRQTKTCQAKWTLIAFKPKLSFFCRSPTTTRYTNGFHLALVTCNTRPLKQLLGRL